MPICLIGGNEEVLNSLILQISDPDTSIFTDGMDLMQAVEKVDKELPVLILFDINIPISNFELVNDLLRSKFPNASVWAIFESKSEVLKNKLYRWGFEKIISYQDDLEELTSGFQSLK